MDFDKILSGYKGKVCILSVEEYEDGKYGNITIVAGNKAHYDEMEFVMHHPFVPGSPYEEYFPKERNFEDYCYRSAIKGRPLHTYVCLPQMGLWLNMFLIPLESDREGVGYCVYLYEVTPEADLEQRVSLSADISSVVLQTCIKLRSSNNTREAFDVVIEDIRNMCESDYCCVLLTDKQTRTCYKFGESIKPGKGILSIDNFLDDGFFDITETWKDTIGDSTCLILKDEDDLMWLKSVNPVWYESFTGSGARNIVLFPLYYNGKNLGYVWVVDFNIYNTVKIKETLELTAFFLASEIANYQLLNKFETLSLVDIMTGVNNRNAMNKAVDKLLKGKEKIEFPFSIISTDLNGLKRVNDEKGHIEGDMLLKKAADILKEVFHGAEIFRAGGDEFVIIARGMGDEELSKKLKMLDKKVNIEDGVFLAVGSYTLHEGDDLREAMRRADENMYINKKDYYEKNPDKRYR